MLPFILSLKNRERTIARDLLFKHPHAALQCIGLCFKLLDFFIARDSYRWPSFNSALYRIKCYDSSAAQLNAGEAVGALAESGHAGVAC